MAYGNMTNAVAGAVASAAANNQIITNVEDLDTRLDVVEARTIDTATSPGGIGNQRLADRFGSTVGTGANVLTGSASSQLTDIRTRLTAVEARATALEAVNAWPIVTVKRATNQTIATTLSTAISWSGVDQNPNSMWSAGSPTRITIPASQTGWYQINAMIIYANNGTGGRTLDLLVNGTTVIRSGSTPGIATSHSELSSSTVRFFTAGDYFEVRVWQNSGGNLDLTALDLGPTMTVMRIR